MSRRMALPDGPSDPLAIEGGHLGRLLRAFSAGGRAQLRDMARTRAVPRRTTLIADGEDLAEVGFVLEGTLAMSKLLPDGRGHIIGLLVPNDLYGRPFGGPSRYQVESLSDVRLLAFRRAAFEALLVTEPEAERLLLIQVLDELDLARESVLLLNGSKVLSRVAAFLAMLARRGGAEPSREPIVRVPLRRADLASYLGARPETLSRAFHDLEARGVLRILGPYQFLITDLAALHDLSGQDIAPPAG